MSMKWYQKLKLHFKNCTMMTKMTGTQRNTYPIMFENLKKYGCQRIDSMTKRHHLSNRIRYDKMFTVVAAFMTHLDKCKKDFDAVVAYLL